jgi:hypothetical protein
MAVWIASPLWKLIVMWTWSSISPGRTVALDRSMTSAPAGVTKPGCTAVIRSSWMRIETCVFGAAPVPSTSRPAWITMSLAQAAPAARPSTAALAAAAISFSFRNAMPKSPEIKAGR